MCTHESIGIVPRAIQTIFERIRQQQEKHGDRYTHEMFVSFLELYNEEIIDLLNPQSRDAVTGIQYIFLCCVCMKSIDIERCILAGRRPTTFSIREDAQGGIFWSGIKEESVSSPEDLFE